MTRMGMGRCRTKRKEAGAEHGHDEGEDEQLLNRVSGEAAPE